MQEKNFFYRLALNIDWILLLSLIAILAIGFLSIYSATYSYYGLKYVSVQTLALGIGFVLMLILSSFNYQHYEQMDKIIYVLSLLLLISVLILGMTVRGTKGWFNFGFVSFQPVEIAKIMYILILAAFLNKNGKDAKKFQFLFYAFLLLLGHLFLIMLQPDFSSTLSYFPVTLVLLYFIGVEPFYLFCILLFGSLAAGIPLISTFFKLQYNLDRNANFIIHIYSFIKDGYVWLFCIIAVLLAIAALWWLLIKLKMRVPIIYPIILCACIILGCVSSIAVEKSLKEYQRKRLVVFLNPKIDSRGAGYNIIQSKIAIGSGKIIGKGYQKGTQTQLGFLPEQHTDFIFSVIGEEGGWLISQLTLLFYFLLIWRAMSIARDSRDSYGSLVATGIATMFSFYAFINIGMVMGMMPVTGIPLLLLSYGGSSMVSSMCAIGILNSIHIHRHTYYKTSIEIF
ncbi:MAG: rod shape-determining protein RodA [Elusimicrobiota bacterium]|jgi:rod shape determining protein RodA|nr:rod shape-determining protein RodA [Elusimicrobiota bacterium]